jgi:hypothetical protein
VRRGGISFGTIYLIVGVIVAALNDYFEHLGTIRRVGEAVIAVFIWPVILLGVDVQLK